MYLEVAGSYIIMTIQNWRHLTEAPLQDDFIANFYLQRHEPTDKD